MTKQNDKLDEILAGVNEGKEESRKTREMVTEMMAMMMQRKPNALIGATAQSKAAELWRRYKYSSEVKRNGRKATYASVFNTCKIDLALLGITDVKMFRRAVKNDQKNISRWSKTC